MRLVADMVKGMPVEKALNILDFIPRIAAHHLAKTLKSAAANALSLEGTDQLKPEDLYVKSITVDAAPTQKRIRFQSMGRVYRYRKRFSHLTVMLEERPRSETAEPRKAEAKEATGAKRKAGGKRGSGKAAKETKAKSSASRKKGTGAKREKAASAKKSGAESKRRQAKKESKAEAEAPADSAGDQGKEE
jgi:large subunit ribosomal protein L22